MSSSTEARRTAWPGEPHGAVTNLPVSPRDRVLLVAPSHAEVHPAGSRLLVRPRKTTRPRKQYLLEGPGWRSLQLLSDLTASLVAVVAALLLSGQAESIALSRPSAFAFPLVVVTMLYLRGMYRRRVRTVILDGLAPVAGAVSGAAMLILAYEVFVHGEVATAPVLGRAWLLTLLLLGGARAALAITQRTARSRGAVGKPTLIIGAGYVGSQIERRLEEHPEYGLRPIGYLDADPPHAEDVPLRQAPLLGTPDELSQVAAKTGAEHVILAFSSAPDRGLLPLARRCEELGLEVSLVPRFFESITDRVALERLGGLPLLGLRSIDPKGWQFRVKYALDRPLALIGLIAVAPILLVLASLVKFTSPGPVFFRQRRVGRDGLTFDLLKFRSMRVAEEPSEFELRRGLAPGGIEGADRRTPVGRFLRRSGLDELPQLFNVLKGEMSLIGPRPERPDFVELFSDDLDRYVDRHRVKSGITGWSQVNGLRGQTSLSDRVEWDNHYIENWSLWLDLKIILLTVEAVLRTGHDA